MWPGYGLLTGYPTLGLHLCFVPWRRGPGEIGFEGLLAGDVIGSHRVRRRSDGGGKTSNHMTLVLILLAEYLSPLCSWGRGCMYRSIVAQNGALPSCGIVCQSKTLCRSTHQKRRRARIWDGGVEQKQWYLEGT
jgi:hypothetical protein